MDTELFELCKEVYKRFPDWLPELRTATTHGYYRRQHHWSGNIETQASDPELLWYEGKNVDFPWELVAPLYTSDYLLEKLAGFIPAIFTRPEDMGQWTASSRYINAEGEDDTPLKALLKLTIALHDAGELK